MERLICQNCGESLRKEGEEYFCPYCGARYRDNQAEYAAELLRNALDDFRIENLARARRVLYQAVHAKYPSKQVVIQAATNVLSTHPEDFLARIYLHSHDGDPYELIECLAKENVSFWEAKEVYNWLIRSLENRVVGALKDFVDRHFEGREKTEALIAIEDEAYKLDSGVYDLTLKRDAFLCYSAEDMPRVIEIMNLFEENGLTCFAAFRNLRHGKAAQDNYQDAIFKAMKNCRVFVFLSSNSSRSPERKGVREELDFLISDLKKKPRVEFLLEEYSSRTPILAKRRLEEAFPHLEYCRDEQDLVIRVANLLNAEETAEKERIKKLALEAAEKAKMELLAEYQAREEERKKRDAERLSKEEESLKQQQEKARLEREEHARKQKELEEERLRLEKERIELEKKKLEMQSGSMNPADRIDPESMLKMMEQAEALKRKKEQEERKRQEEERRRQEEERKRKQELERRRIEAEKKAKQEAAWEATRKEVEAIRLKNEAQLKKISHPTHEGDFVYFGGYPQSVVTNPSLINELRLCAKTGRFIECRKREYAEVGGRYFLVEPIKWRILSWEGKRCLLLSEFILDCGKFDHQKNDFPDSEIHAWLNKDFYNKAFASESYRLMESSLETKGTGFFKRNVRSVQTTVFLPSKEDMESFEFDFFSDQDRRCKLTDYAKAKGAAIAESGYGWYWISTPNEANRIYVVSSQGFLGWGYVDAENGGIRPKIEIEMDESR